MKAKFVMMSAALALAAAPLGASAPTRSSAPVAEESELTGNGTLFVLAVVALIAAAVVLLPEDAVSP